MDAPHFLDLVHVLRVHRSLIEKYGGIEGVRDDGLLQSAIAMPRASFDSRFLHTDLFEMAAAYLYHSVQNHPFIDGNKRTGAATAIIFLAMNDIEIEADEDRLVELTLAVASGRAKKPEIASFFQTRANPSSAE